MLSCETTAPDERRAKAIHSLVGNRCSHRIDRSLLAQIRFANVIDATNGKPILAKIAPNAHNRDSTPSEQVKTPFPSSRTTTRLSYRAAQTVLGGECPFIRWATQHQLGRGFDLSPHRGNCGPS